MNTKRKFKSEFKAKVVLESLKERSSIEELSKKYDLHPSQISIWRKQFLENSTLVFDTNPKNDKDEKELLIKELYAQIGELKVANDWLKKKLQ
ncbi:MAG: transposase [Bacteroidota bacterium]|jgi:transposase